MVDRLDDLAQNFHRGKEASCAPLVEVRGIFDREYHNLAIACLKSCTEFLRLARQDEKAHAWEMYGQDGVAVFSTDARLKAGLDALPPEDDAHLGRVRYGTKHLTRYNTMIFITTKREEFAKDREVRAMLWIRDEYVGINRHYDIDNFPHPRPLTPPDPVRVKDYHRRKVDLAALVIEVVVNPKATPHLIAEVGDTEDHDLHE